jgi:hypothetical protein
LPGPRPVIKSSGLELLSVIVPFTMKRRAYGEFN